MMNDIHSIKQFLFEKYKGFSDKRIKKIESGDAIVDNRTNQMKDQMEPFSQTSA